MKILETALSLFRSRGFDKVTIDDICEATGIVKSTFYYHYKSKEQLIGDYVSIIDDISSEQIALVLMENTFVKQIWALFEIYLDFADKLGPDLVKQFLISNLNDYKSAIAPRDLKHYEVYINLIDKAQKIGQINNPTPAKELAETCICLADGIYILWAIESGQYSLLETCRQAINHLLLPAEGYKL